MSTDTQPDWARLAGYIVGYQATWITDIGLKSGLFGAIADAGGGIGEQDLAAGLGLDARYVQLWCRSAYAFELLEWDAATGYRLTPALRACCSIRPSRCTWVAGCSSSLLSTRISVPSRST